MRNFFYGLTLGLLGAVLWIIASFVVAAGEFDKNVGGHAKTPVVGWVLLFIGFAVMFVGPILFWVITPIRNRRRRYVPRHSLR